MTEAITHILDPTKRKGMGKNGKPYVIMRVRTDGGKDVDVFAPAAIGDQLEISHNEYGYNGKVIRGAGGSRPAPASADVKAQLDRIEQKLDTLLKDHGEPVQSTVEEFIPGVDDVPTNLDDIPFG